MPSTRERLVAAAKDLIFQGGYVLARAQEEADALAVATGGVLALLLAARPRPDGERQPSTPSRT